MNRILPLVLSLIAFIGCSSKVPPTAGQVIVDEVIQHMARGGLTNLGFGYRAGDDSYAIPPAGWIETRVLPDVEKLFKEYGGGFTEEGARDCEDWSILFAWIAQQKGLKDFGKPAAVGDFWFYSQERKTPHAMNFVVLRDTQGGIQLEFWDYGKVRLVTGRDFSGCFFWGM